MTSSGSSGGSRRLEDGNWEALDVGALSSRGHRAEVRLTRSSRDLEQNVHYFGRKFEGIDIRKIMDQVSSNVYGFVKSLTITRPKNTVRKLRS